MARIDALDSDVNAIDKVLHQPDPGIELHAILALNRRAKPDWAIRGEVAQIIFDKLRDAGEPMTTHSVTIKIHKRRGIAANLPVRTSSALTSALIAKGRRVRLQAFRCKGC